MTNSTGAMSRRARRLAGGLVLSAAVLAGCATSVAGTASPVGGAVASANSTLRSLPDATGPESSAPMTSAAPGTDVTDGTDTPSSGVPSSEVPSSESPGSETGTESGEPSSSASGGTAAVAPTAFAAKLQSANGKITSVTGSIGVDSTAAAVKGTFEESLAAGKVTAIDMKMTVEVSGQSVAFNMLIKDNKVYLGGATILGVLGAGDKKWALASETSSNTQLRTLASQLDGYLDTASAEQYALYAKAASSVKDAGEQPLGSIRAHRYEVTVDTTKAAALMTGATRTSMQAAVDAGVKTIPTTIWLDDQNRLVEADSTVSLRGVRSTTKFKVTDYDTKVTIAAPAAADVYTG